MKVKTILNTLVLDVTPAMHKKRRQCLAAMISSLMSGASLTVTSLGRCIQSKTTDKHQIKRSMRLCSNPKLHQEIHAIYARMATHLIGQQVQPVILVDWSDLDPRKQHFLLRASVAIEGRSLTLYEQIYTVAEKDKPRIHKTFMTHLKSMLPPDCKPVIVSDAGFRVPWFELVESLGWDYVGRVRNKTMCRQNEDEDFYLTRTLYQYGTKTAKPLGRYLLRRKNSFECGMVIYRQKPKGRKHCIATGERIRANSNSRSNARREHEPWLLATSLPTGSAREAKKVVKIYRSRMQIEESFRDLKHGLNFNASDSRKLQRITVLLLIAMLAQFVLYLLGMAVTLAGKHRRYQANSLKTKPVLSYQFIGLRAFKDSSIKLKPDDWLAAFLKIQWLMQEHLYV